MKKAKIVGEKVYLRPLELADIDNGWSEWINDISVNRNLAGVFPVTKEDLERYYRESQPPKAVMFAVCLIEDGKYIGNARLSKIDWINRSCEYGRLIGDGNFRGRGYGTEALKLLFHYGFHHLGMNRIFSSAWIENEVSLSSNSKMGMRREGVMKEAVFKNGKFVDVVLLSMTRSEFDKLHGDGEDWYQKQKDLFKSE